MLVKLTKLITEYGREGKVSQKGDVYSYGIMLMETFTKTKPTDDIFNGEMTLRRSVGDSLNHSIMEVVDHDLRLEEDEQFPEREQCMHAILCLAMNCTAESPEDRPDIKHVVTKLMKLREAFLSTQEA